MNVKNPNSFINNKNNNNKNNNNTIQKCKFNNSHQILTNRISKNKNIIQSDKKLKTNNSPYYNLHQKKFNNVNVNYTNNKTSAEKQKILLQKRELEIQDLKMKCEKLEQENHKYQLQNILLKNNYNNNNINNILSNNTSSNFPIKNEVKNIWENFAKIELLNNFIELENEPEIIYHLICELILLSDKMIKEHCTLKYKEIIKIMGIKNNSVIIKDIETQFKNFMKEHLNEIFNYLQDKTFINEYKNQLKNIIKNTIHCIDDNNMVIIEDILEQNEFNDMLKNINDIILFTQFNEPSLYFRIENKYEKRKIKYLKINNENKKEYIIINNKGKLNGFINTIVLLEPPTLKSGFIYYNELKPILIIINKDFKEMKEENNTKDDTKDNINNIDNINTNEFLSLELNDSKKNKEIIDEQIKFNSINNTSHIKRNINIINNKKYKNPNYYTSENYKVNNKKKIYRKKNENGKSSDKDYNKLNKDLFKDKDSYYKDNKKLKKIISISSTRETAKGTKTIKKIKISKYLNLDDQKFYSTDENGFFNKKRNKFTITNKFLINKGNNQIHRIQSANNYFDKNKKINKGKNTFLKHKTDMNIKEGTFKTNNNYQEYINNNNNNENNSNKNIFINSSEGNQSLSKRKSLQKPEYPLNNKNIKNKMNNTTNNYLNSNNNKSNILINTKKSSNNKSNQKSYNNNNRTLKNSKSKMNVKTNHYQSKILMTNKLVIKNIISSSKSIKNNINKDISKENLLNEKEKEKNNYKNIKGVKNIMYKVKNIKNNYSNNNLLNNNRKLNLYYSDLSTKRSKPKVKRLETNEPRYSLAYSSLEEIKKLMDDGNHTHQPVIIISSNSNNNTINANKQLKTIKQNFSKKYKNIGKKNNNNNNKENSIKQLISLSQPKILDIGNINLNYNNIFIEDKPKKMNTKSLETINICINNNRHKYINNRGLYYKQFSLDETTFNTSSQFNLTHDYNNKTNINNHNQLFKMSKNKKNKTLPNEAKIKNKSTNNKNLNIHYNTNKNRIKEIKINIEGFNNNYNTINARLNKNRFHNFFS